MSVFYLDFLNGNDSNDGTTFANRWKTITSGATAARIAPGDTIRIMQSGIPTTIGNATWYCNSSTVILENSLTKNIDMCETAWTSNNANVTCSTNSNCMEGTACATFVVGSSFTTGLMAYKNLGSAENFSDYQQISFWISSNFPISSNMLKISLCSGTNGTTEVNQFVVPAMSGTNAYWTLLTLDYGGALGNSIQSIGLFALSDPGTPTISLDCVIACKANSAENSLTMSDLISKNTTDEGWYAIKSINGTTLKLCSNRITTELHTGYMYTGKTETCTTYKINTIPFYGLQSIQDSGTIDSYITFSGGWDTTNMTSQTGMTFIDGIYDTNNALNITTNGKSFINIEKINICRTRYGFLTTSDSYYINFLGKIYSIANTHYGFSLSHTFGTIDELYSICSGSSNSNVGSYLYTHQIIINKLFIYYFNHNFYSSFSLYGTNNIIKKLFISNCKYCSFLEQSYNNKIYDLTILNSSGVNNYNSTNYFINSSLHPSTNPLITTTAYANFEFILKNENKETNINTIYGDGYIITSIPNKGRNTQSGLAWNIKATNLTRKSNYPILFKIATVACNANKEVTVTAYIKSTNPYTSAQLFVPSLQPGIATDQYQNMTGTNNTYNLTTLQFTPTSVGVIEVYLKCWNNYFTYDVYIDDINITQVS